MYLPSDQRNLWPTGSRSISLQTDLLDTSLLQLETRPSGGSSGCLPTGLEPIEGVCQSSLVSHRQSSEPSTLAEGSAGASSTSVEGSSLVSSASGNAVGIPLSDCPSTRPDSEANRLLDGDGPSTSHMACLWERFTDSHLSEEATQLMPQSWRTKSAQSYDSHFRKWVRWCSERGRNPISGPASDVAIFLAELFEEGHQSRSLNVFRSAISSVHDQVDGVVVGKHPVICRLLKGAFHAWPPLPRYTATWDVGIVLQYLESIGPTTSLSLKLLTFKLVMLLALTRPSRSADLASLQLDRHQFRQEGVVFLPTSLAKQSAQGKPLRSTSSFPSHITQSFVLLTL